MPGAYRAGRRGRLPGGTAGCREGRAQFVGVDGPARVRADLGASTLYRHFPRKEDLVEAMLDELIADVRRNAERADRIEDAREAFRYVFTHSCGMTPQEIALFAQLAAFSPGAGRHAQRLIISVVSPVAARLREADGLRPDITDDDLAMFVRMVEVADTPDRREKALDVIVTALTTAPSAQRSPSTG
ncbi:TetR/AcrR family transcriptional regulator [Streptomyces sp. NPDC002018]|uniref:TetR/AcrR family transcriptional regulator n=1 Tax=Streptomyces sp. NPDC002018 TaxID=3364629 RepID=UPI0036AE07FF